jgi:hypothetical protein
VSYLRDTTPKPGGVTVFPVFPYWDACPTLANTCHCDFLCHHHPQWLGACACACVPSLCSIQRPLSRSSKPQIEDRGGVAAFSVSFSSYESSTSPNLSSRSPLSFTHGSKDTQTRSQGQTVSCQLRPTCRHQCRLRISFALSCSQCHPAI